MYIGSYYTTYSTVTCSYLHCNCLFSLNACTRILSLVMTIAIWCFSGQFDLLSLCFHRGVFDSTSLLSVCKLQIPF
uniref:Uncharacterized protein n=1 Tax=Arundo donax TaxID=35708 RepID=A0A0A9AMI9_ARUDO